MSNLPSMFFGEHVRSINAFYIDMKVLEERTKYVFDQFVISLLVRGHKTVHFAGAQTEIDNTKAIIIAPSNCLMTNRGVGSSDYESLLLFFSKEKLAEFLANHNIQLSEGKTLQKSGPYFVLEQDVEVKKIIANTKKHLATNSPAQMAFLEEQLDAILSHLHTKYGKRFSEYLQYSLMSQDNQNFKLKMEANKYSNLSIDELAFLCHMSVSTFKRKFAEIFQDTPANWFKKNRLEQAKMLIESGKARASEIHEMMGYKNLSHFSTAFKAQFGSSPKHFDPN